MSTTSHQPSNAKKPKWMETGMNQAYEAHYTSKQRTHKHASPVASLKPITEGTEDK